MTEGFICYYSCSMNPAYAGIVQKVFDDNSGVSAQDFFVKSFTRRFEFAKFSKTVEDDFNRVIKVIESMGRECEMDGFKYYCTWKLDIKSVFDMINGYYIEKPKKYKRLEDFFQDEQIIKHELTNDQGKHKVKYGYYLNGKIHWGEETYISLHEFVSSHIKAERQLKGPPHIDGSSDITDDYAWDHCTCLVKSEIHNVNYSINQTNLSSSHNWISTREWQKLIDNFDS